MASDNWVSFSLHLGLNNIYDELPSSIKMWKEEFFFVHDSTFARLIKFGDSVETGPGPVPDSTKKRKGYC